MLRSPSTKPPQLAHSNPTHHFGYMEENEGKKREHTISSSLRASSWRKSEQSILLIRERLWDSLNNML